MRLFPLFLVAVALAAAGGAAIAVVLTGGGGGTTETVTVTATETETVSASQLPEAVERTRAAVHAAAQAEDYEALAELTGPGFSYSFGGGEGSAVDFWRRLEAEGEDPLGALARVLELPYTLSRGVYVWPFAYDKAPGELGPHGRELLGEMATDYVGDSYYGWRAGIAADGTWQFFVAGD